MKKTILAATAALLASTTMASTMASAADLDRELGLIVSGVVDKWAGVQLISNSPQAFPAGDSDTLFAGGGEGRLSLPLGGNWSVQSDIKYEYNSYALEAPNQNDVYGPRYLFQGAGHFSYRDPSSFLIGVFGGAGAAASYLDRYDISFIGGEAQIYMNDITFYAQGGLVDFDARSAINVPLDDGFFGRGVVRWFITPESRLQLEGTYLSADYIAGLGSMDAFSVKARYDFNLNLPVLGQSPLYLAYRGTFRDSCAAQFNGADVDDHTFMIGTSYSFSGDMLTVDRQGATLDTPDFNYACAGTTAFIDD